MFVSLSLHPSISLSLFVPLCLFASLSGPLYIYPSFSLSLCLSIPLSLCISPFFVSISPLSLFFSLSMSVSFSVSLNTYFFSLSVSVCLSLHPSISFTLCRTKPLVPLSLCHYVPLSFCLSLSPS